MGVFISQKIKNVIGFIRMVKVGLNLYPNMYYPKDVKKEKALKEKEQI